MMTLTDNGKDWLARNAGVNNCFASSGVSYKDLEGNSHTGSTTDVAAMLVVAMLVGETTKEIVNGKSYDDFKSANGGYDIDIEDVGTVYDLQEAPTPYCAAVVTPTPTPTVTPTPTPVPNSEVCTYVESAGKGELTAEHVLAIFYKYKGWDAEAEAKRLAIPADKRPASIPYPASGDQILGVFYYYKGWYEEGDAKIGCGWS